MDESHEKAHITDAINFLCSYISPNEVIERKKTAFERIELTAPLKSERNNLCLSSDKDRLFSYIVLAELYVNNSSYYDFFQGSRIMPFFVAIGRSIDKIKTVGSLDDKMSELVRRKNNDPDGEIFELLVANLYKANGFLNIEFVKRNPPFKTPDILICGDKDVYIECKRMTKISKYSIAERSKWRNLWSPVGEIIARRRIPIVLEIIFHEQLCYLSDDYLFQLLATKLKLIPETLSSVVIDNEKVKIICRPVDKKKIYFHLREYLVSAYSPSLIDLVIGNHRPRGAYTLILDAAPSREHPQYVDEIKFAAGATWRCDSVEALNNKSRHIKRLLNEAITQIPDNEYGIIHLGIEAIEGDEVEQLRMIKNKDIVELFDFGKKKIQWIHIHLLSPIATKDENWAFEETVESYKYIFTTLPPLSDYNITPVDTASDGYAWDYRAPL